MKFQKPENNSYCATVVRIQNIVPLPNCDNVVATTIFGFQAIVGKDTQIGDMGIVFPVETQLSDEYCKENNLYRHEEYNKDPLHKGYLEDNRRVKAIKFRGNVSNALFMPLDSVAYAMEKGQAIDEGDEFDQINGKEICKKYMVTRNSLRGSAYGQLPKPKRVDRQHFPEHFTTDNYFKNNRNIKSDELVIITQKLHGTSIRIANTIVTRKLNLRDKIAKWFGATVQTTEFATVFGSRKVLKDPNNPDQQHYYETDLWTLEGKKLEDQIPQNFMVYGELVGWTPDGAPIQSDYTYCLPKGTCRLYVYRVSFINAQGLEVDLSWDQVKEFCLQRNMSAVPELARHSHQEFDPAAYLDKRIKEMMDVALPLDPGMVDEGVCIRVERIRPQIYKAKSSKFFEHETRLLDKGAEDMESMESGDDGSSSHLLISSL